VGEQTKAQRQLRCFVNATAKFWQRLSNQSLNTVVREGSTSGLGFLDPVESGLFMYAAIGAGFRETGRLGAFLLPCARISL